MKNVQISRQLFCYLVEYFIQDKRDNLTEEVIIEMLIEKAKRMGNRAEYERNLKRNEHL